MATTRAFHLGDILSVITGRLVSPRRVDALYDLLNFMTGDNLFTHQLPRACKECAPDLLRQYPDLREVEVPETFADETAVWEWLARQVERFGETREVSALAPADHTQIDPLVELHMMRPDVPTMVIRVNEEGAA